MLEFRKYRIARFARIAKIACISGNAGISRLARIARMSRIAKNSRMTRIQDVLAANLFCTCKPRATESLPLHSHWVKSADEEEWHMRHVKMVTAKVVCEPDNSGIIPA